MRKRIFGWGVALGKRFHGSGISRFPLLVVLWELFWTKIVRCERIPVNVHGLRLWVDPADMGCGIGFLMRGENFDRFITRLFDASLTPGMNVVDVGANIGAVSLLAARRVGETGRVFAFEPNPANYAFLQQNIKENGAANIVAEQKALSDTSGTSHLFLCPQYRAGSARGKIFETEKGWKGIEIETVTLDSWFSAQNVPVHLVKIDVEGAEEKVFNGMQETVRRNPHMLLLLEFIPCLLTFAGTDPLAFLDRLHASGFSLYEMNDDGAYFMATSADALAFCERRGGGINLLCCNRFPEKLAL
jgi:FkbM family methyltransferase